jgi:hypothetical protein
LPLVLLLLLPLLQHHSLILITFFCFVLISIEDFFFDDRSITPENPWKPLPKHSVEQSPCYPIIGMHNKYRVSFYYCKLHPDIENTYLESIEHHCKFSNPEFHKSEILKFLEKILASHKRIIETK